MTITPDERPGSDLPVAIGNPARRALANAGLTRLEHLTTVTERETGQLHGVGPKAIRILTAALAEQGLAFREDAPPPGQPGSNRQ